jgi:hypothetical protein
MKTVSKIAAKTVTIAGRAYKPVVDSTLEHDIWTTRQITRCGLDAVEIANGETADLFAHRILMQAAENGNVFDLLGGLLMPVSVTAENWTPQLAAETGRCFAEVCKPEDKAAVRNQITEALMGFFAKGLSRLKPSPRSSNAEETSPNPSTPTGEQPTTTDGPASYENSDATIPHECAGSCAGPCEKQCSHT